MSSKLLVLQYWIFDLSWYIKMKIFNLVLLVAKNHMVMGLNLASSKF